MKVNTTVIAISLVSISELYINNEMEYTLFLWVFYGIWRVIKLLTTGE